MNAEAMTIVFVLVVAVTALLLAVCLVVMGGYAIKGLITGEGIAAATREMRAEW